MVEVDEFKFSKIISNVIQKSYNSLLDDDISGMSEDETELSADEDDGKMEADTMSEIEHKESQ